MTPHELHLSAVMPLPSLLWPPYATLSAVLSSPLLCLFLICITVHRLIIGKTFLILWPYAAVNTAACEIKRSTPWRTRKKQSSGADRRWKACGHCCLFPCQSADHDSRWPLCPVSLVSSCLFSIRRLGPSKSPIGCIFTWDAPIWTSTWYPRRSQKRKPRGLLLLCCC